MNTNPAPDIHPTLPVAGRRRLRRLCGAVASCLVASAGLLATSVLTAQAATGLEAKSPQRTTFGVEPASANGPDGRSQFSYGVTPGARLQDHVVVLDFGDAPLTLQLYATDALETSRGGFGLLPAGARPTGVGAWITIPARDATVHVPGRTAAGPGEVVVPITVAVPADAAAGDHVGGVVASLRVAGRTHQGQNVVVVLRLGTRMFVRVSGILTPKLSVTGLRTSYSGTLDPFGTGSANVSYTVTNAGNVDLGFTQSVSLSGLLGDDHTASGPAVQLLLPGSSVQESVTVPGVWPQFSESAAVTVRATPQQGLASPPTATASTSFWAVPWTLLGVVLVAAAGLVLALRARLRRRSVRVGRRTKLAEA